MNRINLLFLIVLIIFSLSLISCEDSLGIEENYKKNYFEGKYGNDTEEPKDSTIVRINPTEVVTSFRESVNDRELNYSEIYPFFPKDFSMELIKIDTSETIPIIWIDNIYLENKATVGSYEFLGRQEYIKAVHIKLDSIRADGYHYLNGEFSSRTWSKIEVVDIVSNQILTYSGEETRLNIIFEIIRK